MVAKSYNGPTCVGVCPKCDGKTEVPALEQFQRGTGHCPKCDSQVEFEYWDGPVMTV